MKVLVVDDNQLIVDDYLDEVSKIAPDAECIGTSRASEVEGLFRENLFDVVLMDIDMPEINGIELAAKLLEIKPNTNIIYITGHEQFALESFSTNPSTFLVKPINTERLRNAFEHLRYPVSKITDESIANEYAGDNLIGRRIAKYRTERNMTREQLAAQLGVTVSTISRWENGKRIPDIVTFLKLAQVLTVEPGDLMY
ncbi:Response regulator receiver domain-containing protein [Ruminococcaceae bacterium FB2012]|nr:Response regulator receiver domain-containing protein [Ruminococcaceae bacterium FB2012]